MKCLLFGLLLITTALSARDDNNDKDGNRNDDDRNDDKPSYKDRTCDGTTEYEFNSYCTCFGRTCTMTTDRDGKDKYDYDVVEVDAANCDRECTTTTTECSGELDETSKCYKSCKDDKVDDSCKSTGDLYGDSDRLDDLSDLCVTRNSELVDCPKYFIRAPKDDESTTKVCPTCIEDCDEYGDYDDDEGAYVRYYKYKERNSDDAPLCKKKRCILTTIEVEDDDAITYSNVRREVIEDGEVAMTFCEPPTRLPTPDSDEGDYNATCFEDCGDDEDEMCVYDAVNDEYLTTCKRQLKCSKMEDSTKDRYVLKSYTRCDELTEDECVVDETDATLTEWKIKDSRSATSRCPVMCKCIKNPRGDDYGNVFVCDGIDKMYKNLREKCAAKLSDSACTFDRMWFNKCPRKEDDDICDELYCDTEQDPNDPDNGGVCRRSSERFADEKPIKRDESVGCFYQECVEGALVSKRYDVFTSMSAGIRRECPKLNDCRSVSYDTNGVCGACPVCDDEPENEVVCDEETMRSGDRACLEDDEAENDETRDEDKRDIAGRLRVALAVRFCADEFLGYTKDEIYSFIRESVYEIVQSEW